MIIWILLAVASVCFTAALVLQHRRHQSSRKTLDPADAIEWFAAKRRGDI